LIAPILVFLATPAVGRPRELLRRSSLRFTSATESMSSVSSAHSDLDFLYRSSRRKCFSHFCRIC
jgi:hypothetical protein